jgi:hypothetical protein
VSVFVSVRVQAWVCARRRFYGCILRVFFTGVFYGCILQVFLWVFFTGVFYGCVLRVYISAYFERHSRYVSIHATLRGVNDNDELCSARLYTPAWNLNLNGARAG